MNVFEFLHIDGRPGKILRTSLYGDQPFDRFELELLHTQALQRLYDLKQLGFADRVFPDAVHSRFNHVLGVTHRAGQMVDCLLGWLERNPGQTYKYQVQGKSEELDGAQLHRHVSAQRASVRLMALLHDVAHAAFGHTLEDEISLFSERHDDPARQAWVFDVVTQQLLAHWTTGVQGVRRSSGVHGRHST